MTNPVEEAALAAAEKAQQEREEERERLRSEEARERERIERLRRERKARERNERDEQERAQRVQEQQEREEQEREEHERLLERERVAEATQREAERLQAEQARIRNERTIMPEISKDQAEFRAKENESNSLEARERIVLEREQAAEAAMREANDLYRENQAAQAEIQANAQANARPIIKVNMDCPLLDECPSFEQYQKLVKMWTKTTDIPKHKLASLLSMTIPVNSTKYGDDLREDLFENIDPELLTDNVDGVKLILDYLRSRIGRNEREAQIETFVRFLKYQRRGGQTIEEYILEFERHYKRCKTLNILFNDNVSAFLLLYNANLNEVEYKLIKGVMNINEDEGKLYRKTREKLLEMLTNSIGEVVNPQSNLGNEILLTQHNNQSLQLNQQALDVLAAHGWKPPSRPNKYQNRTYQASKPYHQANKPDYQKTKPSNNKHFNPKGENGKYLKCYSCDSIRHMIKDCPDSHENNKGKKKTIKKEVYYTVVGESDSESDHESEQSSDEEIRQHMSHHKSASRIVMFTHDKTELSRFTTECLNQGALDTCCTSCVAGKEWVKIYLNALAPELRNKVAGPTQSNRQFLFGNQGTLKSAATYNIPIKVGGKLKMLEIDCIESDIPLLISMTAMKDLGMVLDLKKDRITIEGKQIPVKRTSAGHYTIDLLDTKDQIPIKELFMINEKEDNEEVNLVDLATADEKTQIKLLDKMHKQFGHTNKEKYIQLLKSADQWQDKYSTMIDTITNRCEGCIMRKRTPDRPAVALPLATDFNQVLTMDLKIWNANKHQYIFYMIDAFTRYTVATVINRKTPEQVINGIFEKWIQYFGIPDKVLSDNGGEFSNAEMIEVSNKLNLKLFTTGAHSPWQNGICERNHAHTDNILQSVLRDHPQMSLKTALTWACTAKNSLTTVHGYAPFQLVFGRNIRLPNILNDPPPSYEIKTRSKALADNLTAIHATREAYMKAESCQRLKKALQCKIRTFDHVYEHGDYVYYKRDRNDGWEGPARVVYQDNKVILVRHGGFFYKVSANRIKPAHDDLVKEIKQQDLIDFDPSTYKTKVQTQPKTSNKIPNNSIEVIETASTPKKTDKQLQQTDTPTIPNKDNKEASEGDDNTPEEDNDSSGDSEYNEITIQPTNTPSDNESDTSQNSIDQTTNLPSTNTNQTHTKEPVETNNTNYDTDSSTDLDFQDAKESHTSRSRIKTRNANKNKGKEAMISPNINKPTLKLKPKDRIEIKERNRWQKGIILKLAGKATGKYKDWYNIKLDNGKTFSTNIKQREIRKLTNEQALITWLPQQVLAVMVPRADRNNEACSAAKQEELQKLKEFDTYQIIEDNGQDRIATTWVLTEKADTIRARLTCKGFQEEETFPTDSPTVQRTSVRMILMLATTNKWTIQAIDIKSAFLQGDKLTRQVFVQPPKEANLQNKLWKLKKCLYGLKDASRQWYLRLKRTLRKLGFQKSKYDGGLFFIIKDEKLLGAVGIHVDDFLTAGCDYFMTKIIPSVLEAFLVGKAEDQVFMYTGSKITQDNAGITVDQTDYVQNLEIFDLDPERLKMNTNMHQHEETYLRKYCGSLNWAVGTTRPDLSFQMINLSTNFKGGKISALKQAHSVMKQLKKKPAYIRISNLDNFADCELWCYSDAAHRNLNNNTDSAGGYILFVVNIKNGNCAPLEWRSNKIKRKVVSTLGAEMLSLVTALDAAIGTRDQLCEITAGKINLKVKAITDNKSARDTIYSEKSIDQKRLRADIAGIKESIEDRTIEEVRWVAGQHMLADVLTKQGVKSQNLLSVLQNGTIDQKVLTACKY